MLKVSNILSTAINQRTHHKRIHAVFTGYLNGWITCTHYGWVHRFSKTTEVISNTEVSEEWHTGSSPIDGCCSTQDLKIPRVCLWPHTELQGTFIAGDTRNAESTCVLEDVHIEIQDTFIIRIKHDILNVHKSAAYQNYVHIKASLPSGYTNRIWRLVKMTFIPAPRKVYYIQSKAYWLISLLSFMQKTMQKLVNRNINGETLEHVLYIHNNLPINQGSPQKLQSIMWLHIQREQWKTGSYTWALIDRGSFW